MQKSVRIRSIEGLRKGAFVLALFLLLANVRTAYAHGSAKHVMGTVSTVSAQSVTVETTDKKVVEVGLNSKTKYTRSNKKMAQVDVKVGDRVMIEAKEVNAKLVADSLKLGAPASKPAHAAHSK